MPRYKNSEPEGFFSETDLPSPEELQAWAPYLRPRALEKARRRFHYAREARRIKDTLTRRRRAGRRGKCTLAQLEREMGLARGRLTQALAPSAFREGKDNLDLLFDALSELRMRPKTSWMRKEFQPWRTWSDS